MMHGIIILQKKIFGEIKEIPNVNLFPVENLCDALKISVPRGV